MENEKILSELHEKFCDHRDRHYLLTDRLEHIDAMNIAIQEIEEEYDIDVREKFGIEGNDFSVLLDHGFDFDAPVRRFRADIWNNEFELDVEEDDFEESDLDKVYELLSAAKQEVITVQKIWGGKKIFVGYELADEFFAVPMGTNKHKMVAIYLATQDRVKHSKESFIAFHKVEKLWHAMQSSEDRLLLVARILDYITEDEYWSLYDRDISNKSFSHVNRVWGGSAGLQEVTFRWA